MKNLSARIDLEEAKNLVAARTRVTAAGVAESDYPPINARLVIVTPILDDLYLCNGETAVVPAADGAAISTPLCLPRGSSRIFYLPDQCEFLSIISTAANIVGLEYYGN